MNKEDRVVLDDVKTQLKDIKEDLSNLSAESNVTQTKLDIVISNVNDHLHEHKLLRIATYTAMLSAIVGLILAIVKMS